MKRKNMSIRRTCIDDLSPVETLLSKESIQSVGDGGSFALRKFQVASLLGYVRQNQRLRNGNALFISLVVALLVATNVASAACVIGYHPVDDEEALIETVTNNRAYYLSEIGGCDNLVCWLDNVPNTAFSNATLIVDQSCNLNNQTLVVPPRMVIAGVGMDGEGQLVFEGLNSMQAAIAVTPGPNTAGVTIRDLRIVGDNPKRGRGIELKSAHQVNLERLRISGFGNGIYGSQSFSVVIDKVNMHDNNINILQGFTTNTPSPSIPTPAITKRLSCLRGW